MLHTMKLKLLIGAAVLLAISFVAAQFLTQPADPTAVTSLPTANARLDAPATLVDIGPTEPKRESALSGPPPVLVTESEATYVELEHLLKPLPPGVLEVWVVDETEEQTLAGATVALAAGRKMYSGRAPPKLHEDADRSVRTTPSHRSNRPEPVRFEDLAPGNYYVEVTSLKGSKRSTSITMKDTLGSSHVFRYGTATVYGEVVDRQAGRAPLPGIGLSLRVSPRRRSLSPEQEEFPLEWKQSAPVKEDLYARTDDRGTYVFDELPAGKFSMTFRPYLQTPETGTAGPLPREFLAFELETGESRRIDFPPSLETGGAVWKGRILNEQGTPVATPGFARRHADMRIASWEAPLDESEERKPTTLEKFGQRAFDQRAKYGPDGSFEMALPAGRYDVWITSPHVSTEIHAIQDGGLDLQPGAIVERDLTLPGITLRGQVPGVSPGEPTTKIQRSIGARQSHVTWPSGILTGSAEGNGAFCLYGLEPGDWIVSAARGAYRAETTVHAGDGGASVEFVRKK